MKFEFRAKVVARFELTEAQLNVLAKCADKHYDRTCREANMPATIGNRENGCIWNWTRQLQFEKDFAEQGVVTVEATSSNLDLCCKIMEHLCIGATSEQLVEQTVLFGIFRTALHNSKVLYVKWQVEQEIP